MSKTDNKISLSATGDKVSKQKQMEYYESGQVVIPIGERLYKREGSKASQKGKTINDLAEKVSKAKMKKTYRNFRFSPEGPTDNKSPTETIRT